MFRETLRDMVEATHGALAGLLMGLDGIAVDRYIKPGSKLDVETIGMEYSVVLAQVRKAAEMLDAGEAKEVTIHAESLVTVIRLLSSDYFVALTLKPDGFSGKARYLLRVKSGGLLEGLL